MSNANKALKGSFLLVLTKLSEKSLGIVSTLVLARLLVPDDFGLVAIANLIIGLVSIMADTGSGLYLIQKEEVDDDDINTSWTINLILQTMLFVFLVLITPFASEYYQDDRLLSVIPVLSSMVILGALTNPYLSILIRNQSYELIFKIDIIKKIFSVSVVCIVALIFQNFWALIIGHLVSNMIRVVCSYLYLDYRPKLNLSRVREQWAFSQWMLAKGFLGYSRSQLDTFLISSFYSPAALGGYHISKYISNIPGSEGISPALDPLLASFSKNKNNFDNFKHQIMLTLLVIGATAIPLTAFMFFNSTPIVKLILGENWVDFSSVFGILSLLVIPLAIGKISAQIVISRGRVKALFYYDLFSLMIMAGILFYLSNISLESFSSAKVAVDFILVFLLFIYSAASIFNKELIKITSAFITILFSAFSLAYLSKVYFLTQIPVFISLTLSFSLFCLTWLLFCYAFFYIFLRKNQAALHLKYLIKQFMISCSSKLYKSKA